MYGCLFWDTKLANKFMSEIERVEIY